MVVIFVTNLKFLNCYEEMRWGYTMKENIWLSVKNIWISIFCFNAIPIKWWVWRESKESFFGHFYTDKQIDMSNRLFYIIFKYKNSELLYRLC